jgi:hypothetical protein
LLAVTPSSAEVRSLRQPHSDHAVAEHLETANAAVLAFHRVPQGDLAAEPDRPSPIRLVGAVLAEQNDEWIEGRRYLGLDVLARSRITLIPTDAD